MTFKTIRRTHHRPCDSCLPGKFYTRCLPDIIIILTVRKTGREDLSPVDASVLVLITLYRVLCYCVTVSSVYRIDRTNVCRPSRRRPFGPNKRTADGRHMTAVENSTSDYFSLSHDSIITWSTNDLLFLFTGSILKSGNFKNVLKNDVFFFYTNQSSISGVSTCVRYTLYK